MIVQNILLIIITIIQGKRAVGSAQLTVPAMLHGSTSCGTGGLTTYEFFTQPNRVVSHNGNPALRFDSTVWYVSWVDIWVGLICLQPYSRQNYGFIFVHVQFIFDLLQQCTQRYSSRKRARSKVLCKEEVHTRVLT
jgi:hypothetical protein